MEIRIALGPKSDLHRDGFVGFLFFAEPTPKEPNANFVLDFSPFTTFCSPFTTIVRLPMRRNLPLEPKEFRLGIVDEIKSSSSSEESRDLMLMFSDVGKIDVGKIRPESSFFMPRFGDFDIRRKKDFFPDGSGASSSFVFFILPLDRRLGSFEPVDEFEKRLGSFEPVDEFERRRQMGSFEPVDEFEKRRPSRNSS